MDLHGLRQMSTFVNSQNRTLDLVFANEEASTSCVLATVPEPLVNIDPYHPPFMATLCCSSPIQFEVPADAAALNFRKANFVAMNHALLEVDWDIVRNMSSVDQALAFFSGSLHSTFQQFVPLRRPAQKPPWSNNRLRKLKRLRAAALRRYSNVRNPVTKRAYNLASGRYINYKRHRYSGHIKRTQANLKRNPKQFWSFVDEKRKENGLPSRMFLGDTTSNSLENTCNLFADHFASVFNRSTATPDQIDAALQNVPSNMVDLNLVEFSVDDVSSAILKLKSSFSAGPDGIPAIVLKNCAAALSKPLMMIFNLSIRSGQFPSRWKESYMFPVFKKGNKRDVANYRGITSLCAGSKLMEILMQQALLRATRMYISNDQHGFYPGRSTNTNLVEFTSFCIRTMEGGGQVDAVYTDLKAAFDRIDHKLLLAKLSRIGVGEGIVRWFESYLTSRSLTVKLGNAESLCFSNSSGVPQGSNIGPLLFSVFYNDVCLVLPPGCRILYADDLKIFREITCTANCANLQQMINVFTEWCAANFLCVSASKCNVISFTRKKNSLCWPYTINGEPLERVSVVKDLGVLLDAKMTFEDHYNSVLSKSNRNLGFMLRMTKEFRDPSCLRVLFFALVRSHLESAVVVWCPSSDLWINRMESVQRRFTRSMLRLQPWPVPGEMPTYEQRCAWLNLDTLSSRRTYLRAAFIGKVLLGSIDAPNVLARINFNVIPRTLRRRDFLRLDFHSTQYGQNEPIRAMSVVFNSVFDVFNFNLTTDTFVRRLRSFLLH